VSTEATYKAALCKILRNRLPADRSRVYRHEDQFTGGIPDISITAGGFTIWVEVKLDRPGRKSKTTALQLASLKALEGYLLTFGEGKDGFLAAQLQESGGESWVCASRKKSDVLNTIATWLIREVSA
jgi:hypothetical protein